MGYPPMKSSLDELARRIEALPLYDEAAVTKADAAESMRIRAAEVVRATPVADTAGIDAAFGIRATHPSGFRSGEWAVVTGLEWANDRPCYRVRFVDGAMDSWVVNDPSDPYEFRAALRTPKPEGGLE